jgi:uncharacterized membrane protein YccC
MIKRILAGLVVGVAIGLAIGLIMGSLPRDTLWVLVAVVAVVEAFRLGRKRLR